MHLWMCRPWPNWGFHISSSFSDAAEEEKEEEKDEEEEGEEREDWTNLDKLMLELIIKIVN